MKIDYKHTYKVYMKTFCASESTNIMIMHTEVMFDSYQVLEIHNSGDHGLN